MSSVFAISAVFWRKLHRGGLPGRRRASRPLQAPAHWENISPSRRHPCSHRLRGSLRSGDTSAKRRGAWPSLHRVRGRDAPRRVLRVEIGGVEPLEAGVERGGGAAHAAFAHDRLLLEVQLQDVDNISRSPISHFSTFPLLHFSTFSFLHHAPLLRIWPLHGARMVSWVVSVQDLK